MAESYPKVVENTVGKGEIAHYEQFLLFPQCFQQACFPEASKGVIVWEWVKKQKVFFSIAKIFADDKHGTSYRIISMKGKKTSSEKEKLLITSIFSFCHNTYLKKTNFILVG